MELVVLRSVASYEKLLLLLWIEILECQTNIGALQSHEIIINSLLC